MKKILVIGSSGMVGYVLAKHLKESGHVVHTISREGAFDEKTTILDVKCFGAIKEIIIKENFDYIFNCVALLVKESDIKREDAVYVNSLFPQMLNNLTSDMKVKFIHLSTGGVFSNRNVNDENAQISPQNYYAITKSAGEFISEKNLVIRNDFWGIDHNLHGGGVFNWFILQKGELNAFDKVVFNGISNVEFAKKAIDIAQNYSGILHICASEPIAKGQLLRIVKNEFKLDDITLIPKCDVENCVILCSVKNDKVIFSDYLIMVRDLKSYALANKNDYKHVVERLL